MNPHLTAADLLAGKSSIVPRISDAPAALASIALDLAALFDKLSPNDNPTLERGHELITWKEHPELCLEVSGDDGAMIFHGIWAGGVNITDHVATCRLEDAQYNVSEYNRAHNVEQKTAAAQNRDDIKNDK
jgi:hypothetical protein